MRLNRALRFAFFSGQTQRLQLLRSDREPTVGCVCRYGAQPPIELLRQFMDHGGWYDRKERTFKSLVDIVMLCAMGPPGGGRNPITPRMSRHFNLIATTTFEHSTCVFIYKTIIDWYMDQMAASGSVKKLSGPIVTATVDIYDTIGKEKLPTPAKSHYTFNLRDLAKVFQGLMAASKKCWNEEEALLRLWVHENQRVFSDRLTDDTDRKWFTELLDRMLQQHMKKSFQQVIPTGVVMFVDFLQGSDNGEYVEAKDLNALIGALCCIYAMLTKPCMAC